MNVLVFQVLKVALSMTSQAEAFAIEAKTVADAESRDVFLEQVTKLSQPAVAEIQRGNAAQFALLWNAINGEEVRPDWRQNALQPILTNVLKTREAAPLKIGLFSDDAWLFAFETMLGHTGEGGFGKLEGLDEIPADHMISSITTGRSDRASRWWYSLPEKRRSYYIATAKTQNRSFKQLQLALNPEKIEASEIDSEFRIPKVRAFLRHPFIYEMMPFNSGVFKNLISFGCLTEDELFADPDGFVNEHFRQGMAYLDLARIYRQAGRYQDALSAVDRGMTTRLQKTNSLSGHLLERAMIYRDAKKIKAARRSLDSINQKHLDSGNKALYAEVDKPLEDDE